MAFLFYNLPHQIFQQLLPLRVLCQISIQQHPLRLHLQARKIAACQIFKNCFRFDETAQFEQSPAAYIAQLGIPAVVRYGSVAHRLCIVENIPHVAATPDGIAEQLAGPLPPRDEARGRIAASRFAGQSEATLRTALGLAGPAASDRAPPP